MSCSGRQEGIYKVIGPSTVNTEGVCHRASQSCPRRSQELAYMHLAQPFHMHGANALDDFVFWALATNTASGKSVMLT